MSVSLITKTVHIAKFTAYMVNKDNYFYCNSENLTTTVLNSMIAWNLVARTISMFNFFKYEYMFDFSIIYVFNCWAGEDGI